MVEPYGFANRCLAEVTAEMLQSEDLCKFLYYTQDTSKEDILSYDKPVAAQIVDKNIYTGRRVPDILHRTGAYICTRVNDYAPIQKKSEVMKMVEIEIMVIVHEECEKTIYGTRDVCIVTAIEDALEDKKISGVGRCVVSRITDISGLPIEYSGYFLYLEVQGFPTIKVRR